MKIALLSAFVVLSTGLVAKAGTVQIPVVTAYENLENEKLWKGIDQDEVPLSAIQMREIQIPSRASGGIYLQNDRMIVCYQTCTQTQPKLPLINGKIVLNDLDANKYLAGSRRDEAWKALKVLNVYYWTNRLFDYLETLGYKPSKRLTVIVDRDISDPSGGDAMNNNAFFTEIDWSLNFLPVKNSIVYKILGMNIHSAALDPSVAMHECTHSVFQDLIGSIINPSLFGLHEALADYFSMAVLNTRKLGIIFFSGKTVRTAIDDNDQQKTVYKAGMEAHNLGNVVNTALQHIRIAIPQKRFADLVALETVRELGRAPYIQATQIQSTFVNSMNEVAKAQNQELSAQTVATVNGIWAAYNILAPAAAPILPLEFFKTMKNTSGYFEITLTNQVSEKAAADWHMPAKTVIKAGILSAAKGPSLAVKGQAKPKETQVVFAEVEGDNVTTPLFLHYSADGMLGAYDLTGQLILPNNPDQQGIFAKVVDMNKALPSLISWGSHEGNKGEMFAVLFDGGIPATGDQKAIKAVYKLANQSTTAGTITFSSIGTLDAIKRTGRVETTTLGKVFSALGGGDLSSMSEISVYTIKSNKVPQLKTSEVFPGERLIGYEMRTQTGVVTKVIISDIDADPKSSVLSK